MAGIKRKEAPAIRSNAGSTPKKPKTGVKAKEVKKTVKAPSRNLEAETDSDPIVESDTTDQSGEDDGVSWPSDDEDNLEVVPKSNGKSNGEGGVKLPTAKNSTKTTEASSGNHGEGNCKTLHYTLNSLALLTLVKLPHRKKPTQSQRHWPKSAKQQSRMQIPLLGRRRSGNASEDNHMCLFKSGRSWLLSYLR